MTDGPPRVPSQLSILIVGSLMAVLLFAVLVIGLRASFRAALSEGSHRTGEVAHHLSQAVRTPLRSSANSLTFIAEENQRLQRVAPQQADMLLQGLLVEIHRRQPQLQDIAFREGDGPAAVLGLPAAMEEGAVSCVAHTPSAADAPCFGIIVHAPAGDVLPLAAPLDVRRWVVGALQVAAIERALDTVPRVGDLSFELVDAHGRVLVRRTHATQASGEPWWMRRLVGADAAGDLSAQSPVEPYPFAVVAHMGYRQALAPWLQQVAAAAAFYVFYLLAFVVLLAAMYRATKVQRYYIQHLQARTQDLRTAQRVGRTAIWSLQGGQLAFTDGLGEVLGSPDGRCGASVRALLARVLPSDRRALVQQVKAAWASREALRVEFCMRAADGSVRRLSAGGQRVADAADTGRMTGTVVDVTEQWEARRRQEESEHLFRLLFERNPLPFWVFDAESLRFLEVNAAAVKAYGYTREEFLAMSIFDLRDSANHAGLMVHLDSPLDERENPRVWVHRTKDGRTMDVRIHAAGIVFNGRPARLILAEDVSEQLAREREMAYRASHDLVTGLPNQHALLGRMDALIAVGHKFCVAYLQVLGMDAIADVFGIHVADGILQDMARRLEKDVAPGEFLASLNSQAFVLVTARDRMDDARLQAIVQCAAEPLHYEKTQHQVDLVIGVASHPQDGTQADVLFGRAALAAHAHVHSDQPIHHFEASLARKSRDSLHFAARLRRAVRRQEFEVHFQPIAAYGDGRLMALEALIRWPQPDGSHIPPSTFIPACEESGLIIPLGQWALGQVAKASVQLEAAGFGGVPIGINVSPAELRGNDLLANIRDARKACSLARGAIHIELTESCLLEHRERAIDVMRQLREDGIAVALDDFGTGFSSLSYLRDLPIDMLKIDQAFIRDVDSDARSATICEAIIMLGKSLGICVIAEGIERFAQYQWLRQHGCDGAQGFYLGRPGPLGEVLAQWQLAKAGSR